MVGSGRRPSGHAHDFFIISDLNRVKCEAGNPDGLGCVVEGLKDDGTTEPIAYSLFERLPKKPTDNSLLGEYKMLRKEIDDKISLTNTLSLSMVTAVITCVVAGFDLSNPVIFVLAIPFIIPVSQRILYYDEGIVGSARTWSRSSSLSSTCSGRPSMRRLPGATSAPVRLDSVNSGPWTDRRVRQGFPR